MTVTRDSMALAMLKFIEMPTSTNNVQSMVCWMASENTSAEWNPCATERGEPNATNFNADGVKNYPTIEEGLQGFSDTIHNGYYQAILQSLSVSNPPAVTCSYIENSAWGSKPNSTLVAAVLNDWNAYASVPVGGSTVDTTVPTPPPEVNTVPNAVAVVPTISGDGYWIVSEDGGVDSFGDAQFYNSLPGVGAHLNAPIVDAARTPSGKGYWLVDAEGEIYAFGDAASHGNKPTS
jgi:hypothetical protein